MVYMLSIGRKFCPRHYVETVENDKASDEVKDPKKMIICTVILILVVLGMAFEYWYTNANYCDNRSVSLRINRLFI
jgi:hypothetical protein